MKLSQILAKLDKEAADKVRQVIALDYSNPFEVKKAMKQANKVAQARREQLEKTYPKLYNAILKNKDFGEEFLSTLQEGYLYEHPRFKEKIYRIGDAGHSWFFDEEGEVIGEEDEGLDIKRVPKLINKITNWAIEGIPFSRKIIL